MYMDCVITGVSTHSRAEAAARAGSPENAMAIRFNTQPRGGGCMCLPCLSNQINKCFNTQPRGGGCTAADEVEKLSDCFNTQPRGGGCLPLKE